MKLEKISDNQIRCTLTKEDLESRHIRISELAYGSDKARALFQDMMKQARARFGFNADNIPLMIEAIPVREDSITLIITKVEDPEDLDRFWAARRKRGGHRRHSAPVLQQRCDKTGYDARDKRKGEKRVEPDGEPFAEDT